jgi:hypothetical protein
MGKHLTRIVLVLALAATGYAIDIEYSRQSLKGLRGVCVAVADLRPEVKQAGLTVEMIQTDAELKLRLAGIRVLTADDCAKEPGQPLLLLNATVSGPPPYWRFSVTVALSQMVQLIRDPAIVVPADTWSEVGVNGLAPAAAMPDMIRSGSKDLVDKFINAYLSVNPKK